MPLKPGVTVVVLGSDRSQVTAAAGQADLSRWVAASAQSTRAACRRDRIFAQREALKPLQHVGECVGRTTSTKKHLLISSNASPDSQIDKLGITGSAQ